MIGEIIAIGDELTSGRILNSTSYFAASQLFAVGHEIVSMSTIGDSPEIICTALQKALDRADFVILTGGLGATSDDMTNEAVASALGRTVIFYPEIFAKISHRIDPGGTKQTPKPVIDKGKNSQTANSALPNLEKLAWLPEGAELLKPEARMAGYFLVHEGKPIFLLPGVPHEMKELLVDRVIPYLASLKDKGLRQVKQKVYKVFGLPETEINKKLAELEALEQNIRIGYYPVFPEVHVSLTVLSRERQEIEQTFKRVDAELKDILDHYIYGSDDDSMEMVIGRLLVAQKKTVAVAESCSGGLVSHKITKIPGSSSYFVGGVVAYSNYLKESILGVDALILKEHGAVSAQTARAMAEGVRKLSSANFGVSVTGIAGPTGGSWEKPVGTVYIGLSTPDKNRDFLYNFSGDRWQIQEITTFSALDLLRRELLSVLNSRP